MKQVDKPLKEINYVVFFLNFLSTKRHKVSSFNQTLHKVVPIFKNQSIREIHVLRIDIISYYRIQSTLSLHYFEHPLLWNKLYRKPFLVF